MEETTPTPAPTPAPASVTQTTTPVPAPRESSMLASLGPVLALLVVLIAVIAGGLYVWGSLLSEDDLATPMEDTTQQQNTETNTDASDEINAIEADVNSTDLETIDKEMDDMEAELDAGASIQ